MQGHKQGLGAPLQRKEDDRFLQGRGLYVSDMKLAGQLEVAFVRSPIAHGRILRVRKPASSEFVFVREDLREAEAIVGHSGLPGFQAVPQHPLAHEKVRFVGEAVAMTCASTRAEAEDLAEEVEVDYEELPPITDAFVAVTSSVRVHDELKDNTFVSLQYESGFDEHAARADVIVKRELQLGRQAMVPLEGLAILAYWDGRTDQLVVYASSQSPHLLRIGLAKFLKLPQVKVRVVSPDVGGGFGYKYNLHPEELCVAWLALKHRKPFRYIEDRREHLIAGANTRQHHYWITGYADKRGKLLAVDTSLTIDGGAYSNWHQTIGLEPGQAIGNLPGPYALQGYRANARCIATNKPGFLPYRGVARTGVCFAMELLVDAIARQVGREPCEVRADNLVPAEAMPFRNITKKLFDSGDYKKALELARIKIDLASWRERQRAGEPDGRLIGVGFASYCEQSAHGMSVFTTWGMEFVPGYEQVNVRLTDDGQLEIRSGVHSHGQGLETSLAQVAHEVTGISADAIRVILGDTDQTPFSTGTYASRSIVMATGAVARACEILVERAIVIGAHLMQAAVSTVRYEPGAIVGPLGSVTIRDVSDAWYRRPDQLPPDVDPGGLEITTSYKPDIDTGAFSYATHAAAVAVDPLLGSIEILDYVIVEDCGTLVNPMIVDGQSFGGAAQGIGTALLEESSYDPNGQPLATTFADYKVPSAVEVPEFKIFHLQTPSPVTKFGVKGMGEGGAIAPPAAICNAVNDALQPLGAELLETPLSPVRILAAIHNAKERGLNVATSQAV